MSHRRRQFFIITAWLVTLTAATTIRLLAGPPPSLVETLTVLALWVVPAVVFMTVFRGAPPQTIGQVLYDAEQAPALDRSRGTVPSPPPVTR